MNNLHLWNGDSFKTLSEDLAKHVFEQLADYSLFWLRYFLKQIFGTCLKRKENLPKKVFFIIFLHSRHVSSQYFKKHLKQKGQQLANSNKKTKFKDDLFVFFSIFQVFNWKLINSKTHCQIKRFFCFSSKQKFCENQFLPNLIFSKEIFIVIYFGYVLDKKLFTPL